ncbi:MAG: sialidase family protein [Chitinophagaceae bacterium]
MKKKISTEFALCVFIIITATAQQKKIPVFESGTAGHKSYRIPAIISLPGGKLFAFCEGRVNGGGDFGDINIVMKTSDDKGQTWSALRTIVDADSLQAGNPAPVVDLTDPLYPSGRIFLFYNTGNNHEGEVRKGNGLREVWYKTSADRGLTWSNATNITLQVHRPRQPRVNAAYNFAEDWRSYANTPGHAMQFNNGNYKGRIFVAANHSAGEPQKHFTDYTAHGFYTDDHGKTFTLSENVPVPGGNENMAVALSGNRLMLNFRNQKGDIKSRIVAVSSNGGGSWDTAWFDKNLPDPVCQGSILQVGSNKGKNIIAFCNAADTVRRDHLTLRISFNEGKTWKENYLIDKATIGYAGDYTAYSDIIAVSKNEIGVLYERNNYKQIVFTIINWKQ